MANKIAGIEILSASNNGQMLDHEGCNIFVPAHYYFAKVGPKVLTFAPSTRLGRVVSKIESAVSQCDWVGQ